LAVKVEKREHSLRRTNVKTRIVKWKGTKKSATNEFIRLELLLEEGPPGEEQSAKTKKGASE